MRYGLQVKHKGLFRPSFLAWFIGHKGQADSLQFIEAYVSVGGVLRSSSLLIGPSAPSTFSCGKGRYRFGEAEY